jgi:rod shape-determining protein MreB
MLQKISKIFSRLSDDLAIDLGTANSLVYAKGRGIVVFEPSVVALNKKTGQVLSIGEEARKMVGRTPAHIVASRPLVNGVISEFEVTEQMLRYFIEKSQGKKFILSKRPRVIVGIPSEVTEVEKKSVRDAAQEAGAREVYLIEQPMAAAIGARLPVQEAGGNFIVDIGGGTTEVAVISLGGLVISKSLKVAGDKLNEDIINFAQEEYKLLIGERTAEEIKTGIGSAFPIKGAPSILKEETKKKNKRKIRQLAGKKQNALSRTVNNPELNNEGKISEEQKSSKKEMSLRGRNIVTGLPEEIIVSEEEIRQATEKSIKQIIETIKMTIEETPPELLSDIMKEGIYLTGGGALLQGLDVLIAKETKIPTKIIDDPLTSVVRGAGMVLENLDGLKDVLVETEDLEPPK